jgi:opacity protein-like surface antigen
MQELSRSAENEMKSKLPTRLVTAVALLAAGATAHGADLDAGYPRMPVLSQWTGVYLGGNLGGAFSEEKAATPLGPWSPNSSGVFGGGQLGYNFFVAPNWLIGIEGELDSSSAQGTVVIPNTVSAATITSNHRWYGTLDGRLGFSQGTWLVYAKGGAAWINVDYRMTGSFNGVTTMASATNTATGWTLGTGVEYMWAPGWSAKAEYDFLDFGTQNVAFGALGTSLAVTTQVHEFKIGVNWHWFQ